MGLVETAPDELIKSDRLTRGTARNYTPGAVL